MFIRTGINFHLPAFIATLFQIHLFTCLELGNLLEVIYLSPLKGLYLWTANSSTLRLQIMERFTPNIRIAGSLSVFIFSISVPKLKAHYIHSSLSVSPSLNFYNNITFGISGFSILIFNFLLLCLR